MTKSTRKLAADLGRVLVARGWRVATAESCTGGLVAGAITDIAGSSDWFERGFVTYSNEAKVDLLGVRPETLSRFGAVSEATAREMVAGALERSRADIAVAITGVAGPAGGTPEKPVGLVWVAWGPREGAGDAVSYRFAGDRAAVREASVAVALTGLIERVAPARRSRLRPPHC
jgi:nicotinamide-nucleotide amidase